MSAGVRLPAPASAALDGLRGVAALMVVASHASGMGLHLVPGLSLAGIGKYGVYLFFVLSAYLLTAQWLGVIGNWAARGRFLGLYLLRRVLRIYPLYALVLLVGWALAPRGLGVRLDGAAVWRHLTLREGLDIYWSVPVEFLYYGVIPLLATWLDLRLHPVWRAGGVAAASTLAMMLWPSAAAPANSIVLGYYLPVFICGSLAAWWMQAGGAGAVAASTAPGQGWRDGLLLLALLPTVPAVYTALGLSSGADSLHRQFLFWGLVWCSVLVGLQSGALPLWARVLCWRGLRACGRWCFGIYLLHVPSLYLAKMLPLPLLVKPWIGLAVALAVAATAYRWVERPAIRLGRRFGGT